MRLRASGRPPSLRWRVVAVVALLIVATNLVVGTVTILAFRGYLLDRIDGELAVASARADAVHRAHGMPTADPADSAASATPAPAADPDHAFIGAPGQSPQTVVALLRDGDVVLAGWIDSSGGRHALTADESAVLAAVPVDGGIVTRTLGSLGDYRVTAVRSADAVSVTALPTGGAADAIGRLALVVMVVTALGGGVAVVAGAVLVRRSLRSLEGVAETAAQVSALDLDRGDADIPLRVDPADLAANREVGEVGAALDRLLGHVGRALRVRRDAETSARAFVADASHELRTPIATIRAYAELGAGERDVAAMRRHMARIRTESLRMGDLVDELLLLARLDADALDAPRRDADGDADGRSPHPGATRAAVDLTAIVVEAAMDARAAAPGHRWSLEVDDEPVVVPGDAGHVRRIVVNLLANAARHTPDGTAVVVSLGRAAGPPDPVARLVVANDGPVIPAAQIPGLFDRFTRGDSARSREGGSTGLGLAIVRAVVEEHGGAIHVVSGPGRTAFRVDLPLLPDP